MEFCKNLSVKFASSIGLELKPEDINTLLCFDEKYCDQILSWIHFVSYFKEESTFWWAVTELNQSVKSLKYLVANLPTVADFVVCFSLASCEYFQAALVTAPPTSSQREAQTSLLEYYNRVLSLGQSDVSSVWLKVKNIPKTASSSVCVGKSSAPGMKFEEGGKFLELPGAKMGEVVVRFPPEASGFMHIGHAKAALLNKHYRDIFNGKLILRFDDTNPVKEKLDYEESILSDLPRIGVTWDMRTHTSDSFDKLIGFCERMIQEGTAYVDNTNVETIRIERENRVASACRENSVDKNLSWWKEMLKGSEFGMMCCVRAKIDMNSNNGALRDPVIYRCKNEPHVRTGSKYKVYPTYDFACPIVDSLEGVTHALRTSEYNDRNDQYTWMCQALGIRCPIVIDYSRLALQHTVLSKRKLTWFVDTGLVTGWDDPRMPTVSGILRRGLTPEGLRQFILAQGSSRSTGMMEWDKIWAFNKKVIDPVAPRYTGLHLDPAVGGFNGHPAGLVPVNIEGMLDDYQHKSVPVHPKNPSMCERLVPLTRRVYVEHADAVGFRVGASVTLINWGNCKVIGVHMRPGLNQVLAVDVSLNLSDTNYKNTLKVTWLPDPELSGVALTPVSCLTYGHLITKPVLGKDEDFESFVNYNSKTESCFLGESCLRDLAKGDIIQLQRKGYYICDRPYELKCASTGAESPCVLIEIPEGSTKIGTVAVGEETPVVAGSSRGKTKPAPAASDNPEDVAKAAEKQRLKDEKKEARKQGRLKAKQEKTGDDVGPAGADCRQQRTNQKQGRTDADTADRQATRNEGQARTETHTHPVAAEPVDEAKKSRAKKQTRLGMEAHKSDNFADWYTEVITKSELLEYYDISGCYILRPWAYSLWQRIQYFLDSNFKELGVENAYFPMFLSKSALEREKHHVEDFSPEVAWVTRSGDTELAEPIAIRPTSETIMYPAFAKWIQSHRDLPLRINQWSNVVRWEFKHPQPFLRTREFLWQEGHTAYADKAEAEKEVLAILDLYARAYEELLAIPVVRGRKTEREKFAGADYTTTVEIYIAGSGRAIQGATSHHLGQNFSRMFNVTYANPSTGLPDFVHQNSWGFTTRSLGVLVMVHGDEKGLVLPPRIAPHQVIVVPCGITATTSDEARDGIVATARQVSGDLKAAGFRVHCDDRTHVSPGWKFNHWELKGVPVRLEIGPQEVKEKTVRLVLRHSGEKLQLSASDLAARLPSVLDDIHRQLFDKASKELSRHVVKVDSVSGLAEALDAKSLGLAAFCGDSDCEERIRQESGRNVLVEPGMPAMGAKSLCIPFVCPALGILAGCSGNTLPTGTKCFNSQHCGRDAEAYTLFGRSY